MIKTAVLVTSKEAFGKTLAPLIGPEWKILTFSSPEEALAAVTKSVPHLILAEMDLVGMNGITFLKLTKDRLEGILPPSVLVVSSPLHETDQTRADALGLLDLLTAPLNAQVLERSLAPLISEAGPMRLSLLEFLAMARRDGLSGVYRIILEAETIEIEAREGRLAHLATAAFLDLWKEALPPVQLPLDAASETILEKLRLLEEVAEPSENLVSKKRDLVLPILGSLPFCQIGTVRLTSPSVESPSIQVNIGTLLAAMVEHVPPGVLDPLKSDMITVRPREGASLQGVNLTPQQGFLLSQCSQPATIRNLLLSGVLPEGESLRGIYLLLLLGILAAEPSPGDPFSLDALISRVEDEKRRARLQEEAIRNLLQSFQSTRVNPYEVLGVSPEASFDAIQDAYGTMMRQLSEPTLRRSVLKKMENEVLLLKAKIGEAFLLLQAFFLKERKLEKQKKIYDASQTIKRIGEAKTEAQQVHESRQIEANRLLKTAMQHLDDGQAYEASQYLKLALHYNPFSSACSHMLGKINMDIPNPRAKYMAERYLRRAMELDPWNVDYVLDLAELYLVQGMGSRCMAHIQQAQKLAPKDTRIPLLKQRLRDKETSKGEKP